MKKYENEDKKGADSEKKVSTLERYKIIANISLGEIVEIEYSMRDIKSVAHKLSNHLNDALLDRSLNTSSVLLNEKIAPPLLTLLKWVFKPVISPKGVAYLNKHDITRAFGALEAVLWARGFKYLATLATSYSAADASEDRIILSAVDSKTRVPDELTEQLQVYYPFTRAQPEIPAVPIKRIVKGTDLASKSISLLADELSNYSWRATCDDSMLIEVFGTPNRRIAVRPDIKIELTKLVIEIGAGTWK